MQGHGTYALDRSNYIFGVSPIRNYSLTSWLGDVSNGVSPVRNYSQTHWLWDVSNGVSVRYRMSGCANLLFAQELAGLPKAGSFWCSGFFIGELIMYLKKILKSLKSQAVVEYIATFIVIAMSVILVFGGFSLDPKRREGNVNMINPLQRIIDAVYTKWGQ